jgi:hypothetical protein
MLPASVKSLDLLRYVSCVGGFHYRRAASASAPPRTAAAGTKPIWRLSEVVAYRVMLGDRVVVDGEATVTGGLLSTD